MSRLKEPPPHLLAGHKTAEAYSEGGTIPQPPIVSQHVPSDRWGKRLLHRWIARLIFAAFLPFEAFSLLRPPSSHGPHRTAPHKIPSQAESGHLIFGKTNSIRAKWLQKYLKTTTYTHVGIVKQHRDQWYVLHASPGSLQQLFRNGGLRCDLWETFVAESQISECAYYKMRADSATQLLEIAEEWVQERVPFDLYYDLDDANRLYCSEFIWRLGLQLGEDWVESRFHQVRLFGLDSPCICPDALAQSTRLERIA